MKTFLSLKKKRAISAAVACGLYFSSFLTANAADFPSYFDWRLNNPADATSGADPMTIVSPVENQGNYGTCWTFGAFSSYESSWLKQLKAAQAAGYNVTPARQIFSKLYMGWTTYSPTVSNMEDNSIYFPLHGVESFDDHLIYYQGGDTARSLIDLVKYGAVAENAPTFATTDEQKLAAYEAMGASLVNNTTKAEQFTVIAMGALVGEYTAKLPDTMTDEEKNDAALSYYFSLTEDQTLDAVGKLIKKASENALMSYVEPMGGIRDIYIVKDMREDMELGVPLTAEEIADVKELIQTEGVIGVAHNAGEISEELRAFRNYGEAYPYFTEATHEQSLVGWDDNYTFQHVTKPDGSPLTGAFLMRNSWGTNYPLKVGGGYGYLSYEDTSVILPAHFNADPDAKRFTLYDMNTPFIDSVDSYEDNDRYGTQNVANSFTAQTDNGQLLKAVMIYASEKNMPYEIIVREGETPGEGTILTQQSGTFGEDGTPKWGGYRTVDLDNYVFLAKDKKYVVEVRTTSPTGQPVFVALMTGLTNGDIDGRITGESYFYDEDWQMWFNSKYVFQVTETSADLGLTADDDYPDGINIPDMNSENYKRVYVFTAARGKESSSPNGGDFRVSWLDDTNSTGESIINLGSASELYGSDYLNPDRVTLSNMTVDLNSGIYNFYRGTIIGEGSLTKTGAGYLSLNGANTYTGGTFVNNGRLDVNGSIVGNAWATDSGIISGSGYIGGTLYNRNRIIAGNIWGYGNLTMQNLVSSGNLVTQLSEEGNTKFIVNETANVDGSTISVPAEIVPVLPEEYVPILQANSVTGTLTNAPIPLSPLMNASFDVSDKEISLATHITNNIGKLNSVQAQSFDAVQDMSRTLRNDPRKLELFPLVYSDAAGAGRALKQMGSSPATEMMSYAQQNSLTGRLLADRFSARDFSNDVWVKFTKNWGKLYGGDDFHGQAVSVGWDRGFSDKWRGGIFASYNASTLDRGEVKDTRGGIYGGFSSGADSAFLYFDGGQVRNKFSRSINALGLGASANYHGTIFEVGGEYKRDLTPDKSYHVSPFLNLQVSHLKQNSYSEHDAGIYNHHVRSKSNTYFAGQIGLEYRRNYDTGNFAARLGVRHAFSGAEPDLTFRYEGGTNSYRLRNRQDKTHFIASLSGEREFSANWTFGGELYLQKGSHDRDLSASLFLRRVW